MTKLEQLYNSIENLKELGVQLPDKLIEETNRVEEEIIKNDIIPTLSDTINPIITQIKRELVLVVEYRPDEPLSVRLTKKRSFAIPAEQDVESVENSNNQEEKRTTFIISPHKKSAKSGLIVAFPNGKTVSNHFASETFAEAIKIIGYEKVEALKIVYCGVPIVSRKKDEFYNQQQIKSGIYVMTHSSNKMKKQLLDEISNRLNLNLEVEVI